MEFNLLTDSVQVKTSNVVRLNEHFTLLTQNGPLDLKVDITADFEDIPLEYHEVFTNILTAKYLNKVSFTQNPFSQCYKRDKKWWQILKQKSKGPKLITAEGAR